MSDTGSLGDEARRLADAFSDWTHNHTSGFAAGAGASEECRFCPLCQLITVLRGDRPEVTARVVEAGALFLAAVRTAMSADGRTSAPTTEPAPASRVQRIVIS